MVYYCCTYHGFSVKAAQEAEEVVAQRLLIMSPCSTCTWSVVRTASLITVFSHDETAVVLLMNGSNLYTTQCGILLDMLVRGIAMNVGPVVYKWMHGRRRATSVLRCKVWVKFLIA